MSGASFHKPLDRIRWRAGRFGLSRSEAVANAEAKLVEIKHEIIGDCERDLNRLEMWAFGDQDSGLGDESAVYEVAQNIAAVIGTFGYDALGRAAFSLCEQLSAEGAEGGVFQLKIKAHIATMARLRQAPREPSLLRAVDGLSSLRAAVAADASPGDGAIVGVVYASLAAGGDGEFLRDAHTLANSISTEALDLGVTGLLLCHAGWFLHWIEGDPSSMAKLYAAMILDDCQSQIKVLSASSLQRRRFSAWRTVSAQSGGAQAALLGQTRPGFSPYDLKPREAGALLEAFASLGEGAALRKA